jgi:hypothetical protein
LVSFFFWCDVRLSLSIYLLYFIDFLLKNGQECTSRCLAVQRDQWEHTHLIQLLLNYVRSHRSSFFVFLILFFFQQRRFYAYLYLLFLLRTHARLCSNLSSLLNVIKNPLSSMDLSILKDLIQKKNHICFIILLVLIKLLIILLFSVIMLIRTDDALFNRTKSHCFWLWIFSKQLACLYVKYYYLVPQNKTRHNMFFLIWTTTTTASINRHYCLPCEMLLIANAICCTETRFEAKEKRKGMNFSFLLWSIRKTRIKRWDEKINHVKNSSSI